ncbi:MAG: hypothetical protein WC747_01950 [Candidatus Babeliales bacterium]|jgi:hypothetical protein
MNKKVLLFFTVAICCIKLQASEVSSIGAEVSSVRSVENTIQHGRSGFYYELDEHASIDGDYGSTSSKGVSARSDSLASSSIASENVNIMGDSFGMLILKKIQCCLPCCVIQVPYPENQSCCCDNFCGKCLFACCMK